MTPEQARTVADQIITDLCGRGGLDGAWDNIDDDIKEEIRMRWVEIIAGTQP